jgi:monoamine oxidase
MKRRDFLQKATLAGSVTLIAGQSFLADASAKPKKQKSVIVIGAGFSGLAAAHKLTKAGVKVTVLEARNRIGGRVFSYKPPEANGQVIELGAEWVGASHERLLALCKEYDLALRDNRFNSHLVYQGKYFKPEEWDFSEKMNAFWDKRREIWAGFNDKQHQQIDKMDWWRYLSTLGIEDRDMDLRELLDSTDFGESNRYVSAFAAFAEYAESSDYNEMDFKIIGGNGLLAEKLADTVGRENIQLQQKVTVVRQTKSGVEVVCEKGGQANTLSADYLICTAPTYSVLNVIQWEPGLSSVMKDALHALQYARIGKFPVIFKERFWGVENFDCVTDGPGHYFYHGTKDQPGDTGILISYATGDKADVLNAQPMEKRLQLILESLKPAFGDVSKYVKAETKYYWGKDPYSYGAYAIYGKGQWFGIMPALQQPHGRVLFAGEHLAEWQGFMEGAIVSGEEAADAII